MRKFLVNALYNVANVLCIAADKLSPADDSVWRERRWEEYEWKVPAWMNYGEDCGLITEEDNE